MRCDWTAGARGALASALMALVLAGASPAAAQQEGKRPSVPFDRSLAGDVALGAAWGFTLGLVVAVGDCLVDQPLETLGLIDQDDDPETEEGCSGTGFGAIALLGGTAVGALVGLVVDALGGDMPYGELIFADERAGSMPVKEGKEPANVIPEPMDVTP